MDATFRPRHFSAELFSYAENKKIFELFQNILQQFCVDRPEKPVEYLYNLLIKKSVYDVPKVYVLGPPSIDRTLVCTDLALKLGLMHITSESLEGDINELDDAEEIVTLVKSRLEKPDCARKGWILEGFPRTRAEAFILRKKAIFPTHIALIEPYDLSEMYSDEMTYEMQDYLGQKSLILDLHKNSYVKKFSADSNVNVAIEKVIEFVQSKMQPPMPYLPRVLLLGPYGSGRRTVAKTLAEKYNLVEVNYHQELRKAAMKESPRKQRICEILQTSSPIPDEMLVEVAAERLLQKDCIESGWVMYNFPDTVRQAELLIKSLEGFQVNRAVFFYVTLQVCLDRVEPRRLDPVTGLHYHLELNVPTARKLREVKEIRARLIQLPQDTRESVEAEYRFFAENVDQLKTFFQRKLSDDITAEVDADQSECEILESVQGAILKSTKMKLVI